MKRIFSLCGLLTTFFLSIANPVVFKQCIPNSGSQITSWNFELQFDITDALAAAAVSNPGVEVGLGVYANTTTQVTTLYKGSVEDNIVLGKTFTKTINGKSTEFVVKGNTVKMSFDSSISIEKGQKYTIVIGNDMALYIKDKATRVASTLLKNNTNPIYLEFYGADLSDSQLFVESCSLESGVQLEALSSLTFDLSSPFTISNGATISVIDGENIITSTDKLTVSKDNPKQLIAEFAEPVKLKYGVNYTVQIPEGTLIHKENTNVSNIAFETNVIGSSFTTIAVSSYYPSDDGVIIPTTAYIRFNMPEGKTLLSKSLDSYSGHTTCILTEGDNTIKKGGDVSSDGKGFIWDFSSFQFKPSTKYILKKEEGTAYVFDENENQYPEFRNEEAIVSWTTPSAEEAGFHPMEFETPQIGKYGDKTTAYSENMELATLSDIQFGLKDRYYTLNGVLYNMVIHPDLMMGAPGYLYEVTDKGDVLVKSYDLRTLPAEDAYNVWNHAFISINTPLYEGKKYKFVIPKGTYTINLKSFENSDLSKVYYVNNPEMVLTFTGTTPAEIKLRSASIENNATCGSISNIIWRFDSDVKLRPEDQYVNVSTTNPTGIVSNSTHEVTLWASYLKLDLTDHISGIPERLSEGWKMQITIPEGLLVYPSDESIINKEIVWTINGSKDTSVAIPSANVILDVNGVHSVSHKAVMGEPYSFTLAHDNNWIVESVTHNGANLASENGTYTTEPLNSDDNNIEAKLKFAVESLVDGTTDVAQLPDSNITVYSEQQHVVVSGLAGNETVSVYAMNGMLVNEHENKGYTDLRISVAPGIYVVLVVDADGNRKAAKVKVD